MIENTENEEITIDGLRFKPYQMQCLEVLARMDGYGNVREWLNKNIVSNLIVTLMSGYPEDFSKIMLRKLKDDGYGW